MDTKWVTSELAWTSHPESGVSLPTVGALGHPPLPHRAGEGLPCPLLSGPQPVCDILVLRVSGSWPAGPSLWRLVSLIPPCSSPAYAIFGLLFSLSSSPPLLEVHSVNVLLGSLERVLA